MEKMNEPGQEKESKRDNVLGRLRKRYPDKQFDDDEAIYGQIGEDYDNLEKENGEMKDREKIMSDMFSTDPRSAEFLTAISKGENPVIVLLREFGPDIKDALDDPERVQEVADAWAEEQKRIAKSQELDEEWAKNMSRSVDNLAEYQKAHGLSDEQADQIIYSLINIVRDGVVGKFSPEMFDIISKAINHDDDVAQAESEGAVAGRNEKITEKLRKSQKGDGIGQLNGRNNGSMDMRSKRPSIFALAEQART